jgi:hypothetical protein
MLGRIPGVEGEMLNGLANPLAAARVVNALFEQARNMGIRLVLSNDFQSFADLRRRVRNEEVSPFFDPSITDLTNGKAFWTAGYDADDRVVSTQAFRIDMVDSCLADWAIGFVVGIYMKRGEVIVPSKIRPPKNSITERVKGRLVYHGEFWISKDVRQRQAVETIPLWGMILAMLKWNPDAIWGIVEDTMATRGFVTRIGYSHIERGFFEWEWLPQGAAAKEWIALSERSDLEYTIEERASTLS